MGNKYSPSYWANQMDPRHLAPEWVRWMLGASVVFAMFFFPLAMLAFVLRIIWLIFTAIFAIF